MKLQYELLESDVYAPKDKLIFNTQIKLARIKGWIKRFRK